MGTSKTCFLEKYLNVSFLIELCFQFESLSQQSTIYSFDFILTVMFNNNSYLEIELKQILDKLDGDRLIGRKSIGRNVVRRGNVIIF